MYGEIKSITKVKNVVLDLTPQGGNQTEDLKQYVDVFGGQMLGGYVVETTKHTFHILGAETRDNVFKEQVDIATDDAVSYFLGRELENVFGVKTPYGRNNFSVTEPIVFDRLLNITLVLSESDMQLPWSERTLTFNVVTRPVTEGNIIPGVVGGDVVILTDGTHMVKRVALGCLVDAKLETPITPEETTKQIIHYYELETGGYGDLTRLLLAHTNLYTEQEFKEMFNEAVRETESFGSSSVEKVITYLTQVRGFQKPEPCVKLSWGYQIELLD